MDNIVAKISTVTKDFFVGTEKPFRALNDINLHFCRGEIYTLVGPSGSGKTTLLHILGLLDSASSGEYIFNGEDISNLSQKKLTKIRSERIAFMFQENYLIPYFTAIENILFPISHQRKVKNSEREKANSLLKELGLGRVINMPIGKLSGGQRQRVCVARALIKSPDILIADEPSASLDSKTTEGVLKIFEEIVEKENLAIVVSTHDKTVIDRLKRNIIEISDGEIC